MNPNDVNYKFFKDQNGNYNVGEGIAPGQTEVSYNDFKNATQNDIGSYGGQKMSRYDFLHSQGNIGSVLDSYASGNAVKAGEMRNGVYVSNSSIAQQNQLDQAVQNGSMKMVSNQNGVPIYQPTTPSAQSSFSGPSPGQAGYQPMGGAASTVNAATGSQGNAVVSPYMNSQGSTPSAPAFNPTSNLAPGSTGTDVKNLQNWLISQGYQIPAGATGIYGDQTKAAVAKWQADNNIDTQGNSGYFGPISRGFLANNPQKGNTFGVNNSGTNPYGTVNPNAAVNIGTSNQPSFGQDALSGLSTQDVLNQRNGMEGTINGYLQQQAQAYADQQKWNTLQALEQQNINYGNALTPDGQVRAGGSTLDAQQAEMNALNTKLNPLKTIADMNYNTAVNALALYKQTPAYQNEQQARDTFYNLAQTYSDTPGGIVYDPSKSASQNLAMAQQKMQASPKYQASLVNLGGYTDAQGVFHTYVRKSPDLASSIQGAASGQLPTAATPHTAVGSYTGGSTGSVKPAQITSPSTRDVVWPGTPTKSSVAAQNDFQTGATGKALTALKTAIGHTFDANLLYGRIDPTQYQGINAVKNFTDTMTGGSAPAAYAQAATLAASELAKVYGADTGGERTSFSAFGAAYQTKAQHDEFVKTTSSLLSSKVGAILDQLKQSGAVVKSLDGVMSPLDQVKLAKLGFNLNGIAPGIGVSPTTQAMVNSYQYYPKDVTLSSGKVVSAGLYAPNAHGGFDKVN